MRVLQLISSSGFFGADNMLIELARELRHTTFSPIIGVFNNLQSPHLEVAQEAEQRNIPAEIFPCKGRLDFRTILLIRRFLFKQKIHIIHTHGYKANLYALTACLGLKVGRISTCHNWLGDEPKMKFYAGLDKSLLNRFDRVVAVSETVKQQILNHKIAPNKVVYIYNGIDPDRFHHREKCDSIRREFGIHKGCRVIGTVGRLSQEKGHMYLVNAADKILQECPKVVFLIVGDGPLKQNLEAKCSQLAERAYTGIGSSKGPFIFAGVRKDMSDIYASMDVFVLPSLTEGLPMALLEAMAAKKPVVATRVGAVPKVIEEGRSGLLVPPRDVNALAKAIIRFLKDPQEARDLAEHGYERVRKDFSSQAMAKTYIEVYQDVLSESGIKH
jgi:glycosyltransferase involved in cell wall biosynthesis